MNLPTSAERAILDLLEGFPSLFSDVPSHTVLEHDIDIGEQAPIKQHPYRFNPMKRQFMKQQVEYLLENHLAVPSANPWCSPCIIVQKDNSPFHFCTYYRKIIAITDYFPLPYVKNCVDCVGTAKFTTKLDFLKGYWQVPHTPHASEISAFATLDKFHK